MAKIMSQPPYTNDGSAAEYEEIVKSFLAVGYAGGSSELDTRITTRLHSHQLASTQ